MKTTIENLNSSLRSINFQNRKLTIGKSFEILFTKLITLSAYIVIIAFKLFLIVAEQIGRFIIGLAQLCGSLFYLALPKNSQQIVDIKDVIVVDFKNRKKKINE